MIRSYVRIIAIMASLAASQLQASTIDVTTSGNWIGQYGQSGYILNNYLGTVGAWVYPASTTNDLAFLPNYVSSYAYSGGAMQFKWNAASNNSWFLQDPRDPTGLRENGMVYDGDYAPTYSTVFTISLTLTADAPAFQLALYSSDNGSNNGRGVAITTKWSGEATAFDSVDLVGSSMGSGEWGVFNVTPNGRTQLDINCTYSPTSSAKEGNIMGVMFHTVPEPGSVVLLATGLMALLTYAWQKRK